jgi:hypothetical protein
MPEEKKDQPAAGPPPARQPSAPRPPQTGGPPKAAGKGEKLVVLHTGVEGFTQGQVITEGDLPEGADLERLLLLGAVRPAEGDEGEQTTVSIDPAESARVADVQRLQAETERQKNQIKELSERLKAAPPARGKAGEESPEVAEDPASVFGQLQAEHQRQTQALGDLKDREKFLVEQGVLPRAGMTQEKGKGK